MQSTLRSPDKWPWLHSKLLQRFSRDWDCFRIGTCCHCFYGNFTRLLPFFDQSLFPSIPTLSLCGAPEESCSIDVLQHTEKENPFRWCVALLRWWREFSLLIRMPHRSRVLLLLLSVKNVKVSWLIEFYTRESFFIFLCRVQRYLKRAYKITKTRRSIKFNTRKWKRA